MNQADTPRRQGRHAGPQPDQGAYGGQMSLELLIERDGPLSPARAAMIGVAVLDQLVSLHNHGMPHGDVRPGSVLVGPHDQVLLTGPTLRSPAYTAPEGNASPAADLWSLGATLYAAVEGNPPSPGAPIRNAGPIAPILFRLLSGDPALRPDPGTIRGELMGISRHAPALPPGLPPDATLVAPRPAAPPPDATLVAAQPAASPPPDATPAAPQPFPPGEAVPPDVHRRTASFPAPPPVPQEGLAPPSPEAAAPASPDMTMPVRVDTPAGTGVPAPGAAGHGAAGHGAAGPGTTDAGATAPTSRDLVPFASRPLRDEPSASVPADSTAPTERSVIRQGVLVPRSVVALTGVLLAGMSIAVGVLLAPVLAGSDEDQAAARPTAGAKARFAAAPRACGLLTDQQAGELVPGFRSSEVELGECNWLNQDWRKPNVEKYDLRVRLVPQKQDASGIARAKEYLAGKKKDTVDKGQFATPKPLPPQDMAGVGEEAFISAAHVPITMYGGSYRVTVIVRVSNMIAEVEYERGGVKTDPDGEIAGNAGKAARWVAEALNANG
ncbi:hypothetical protein HS041_10420 [Planomonospora sp. ID67723]|uniref:hypothetical protein n=1 Tax=Planomonospora sp. ID67723 TaxID=2738134 RepID=UPI0018C42C34|nr:hypothetical protein [Planomonospora sp. ID67723]MBG0828182.1 hypothetical protein [Planomonospora sp. ID67723]